MPENIPAAQRARTEAAIQVGHEPRVSITLACSFMHAARQHAESHLSMSVQPGAAGGVAAVGASF